MLDSILSFLGSYFKDIGDEILHDLKVYFLKKAMNIIEDLLGRWYDSTMNDSDDSENSEVYE